MTTKIKREKSNECVLIPKCSASSSSNVKKDNRMNSSSEVLAKSTYMIHKLCSNGVLFFSLTAYLTS